MADGEVAHDPDADDEGFRAAAHQFDPDPTKGRHPRAALGLAPGRIVAVACDGRSRHDAGLTLVSGGRLQNLPRSDYEVPEPGGRPIATALEFRPV